mgnify:CR=1 FL=1
MSAPRSRAQWFDNDGVDAIADVPTSRRRARGAGGRAQQEQGVPDLRRGVVRPDRQGLRRRPRSIGPTTPSALANGTGSAVVKAGGDTWFFITADYAFGHALERDTAAVVDGERRQGARRGQGAAQQRRFLLLPAAGAGLQGARSSASPMPAATRSTRSSRRPSSASSRAARSSPGCSSSLPTSTASVCRPRTGLQLTEAFYWDQNDETRAWSKRFFDKMNQQADRWCRPASTARSRIT